MACRQLNSRNERSRTEERLISSRKLVAGKRPAFLSAPIVDDRPLQRASLDSFRESAWQTRRRFGFGSINLLSVALCPCFDLRKQSYRCAYDMPRTRCICMYLPFRPRGVCDICSSDFVTFTEDFIDHNWRNCWPGRGSDFSRFSQLAPKSRHFYNGNWDTMCSNEQQAALFVALISIVTLNWTLDVSDSLFYKLEYFIYTTEIVDYKLIRCNLTVIVNFNNL